MDLLVNLLIWAGIFAVFWFLFIRPQKKKQQEHQEMLSDLEVGDQVITIGGIKGSITAIGDEEDLKLKIAPDIEIEVTKRAIGRLDNEPQDSIEN
ncbi:preprotein translocase subunit YajC [Natroniella sulfidigena]|uniref:preprotein translocase subunit YajC n=1 Tax=Natroniella sulfidigena TaxID=723921 RepID=UPI00200B009A|nr:preprotein translocase subunit YajC [Natroniella sulfidigena]MCK8815968.1 preprotein translocase subunit YajC [Natroniella sulfidigena]